MSEEFDRKHPEKEVLFKSNGDGVDDAEVEREIVKEIRKEAKTDRGLADVLRPIDMKHAARIVDVVDDDFTAIDRSISKMQGDEITAIARQLVRKSGGKLSQAEAYDQAWSSPEGVKIRKQADASITQFLNPQIPTNPAEQELQKLALARKDQDGGSYEAAYARICDENPLLYQKAQEMRNAIINSLGR